mmetsp:Transcript_3405/g.4968  ORF Transcript_3405/g.4968 Transcript_3405/m.4968 type:complete len:275 (+) Transcript_3405:69-893(+)
MGKFILIDLKKRDEKKKLRELCHEIVKDFSEWVRNYEVDDNTPPNEEECAALEEAKFEELKAAFQEQAQHLRRITTLVEMKTLDTYAALDMRRGYLYRRFADDVEELEEQAGRMLTHCVKTLETKVSEVSDMLPMTEAQIGEEMEQMKNVLTGWIETNFPDGVGGLDSYDDELPDGTPSYSEFLESVGAAEADLMEKNAAAIEAEVAEAKEEYSTMLKVKVNEAINKAVEEIIQDINEDAKEEEFDYLDEDARAELLETLAQEVKDYGASRLDE